MPLMGLFCASFATASNFWGAPAVMDAVAGLTVTAVSVVMDCATLGWPRVEYGSTASTRT